MPMPMDIPTYTVDFEDKRTLLTWEVLEELSISMNTLMGRRRQNGFPEPVEAGRNGRMAVYDRDEVDDWLVRHGFRVKLRENRGSSP